MTTQVRKNVMDMFINGARYGSTTAITSLLPNVVMAFMIIQALKMTGLFEAIGRICEPIMALQGLPGESVTVLLVAMMSMGDGVSVCASLVVAGTLSGHDATMLLPATYLVGNPVQNVDRYLGAARVHPRYYPPTIVVCVVNALLSIWVMQVVT